MSCSTRASSAYKDGARTLILVADIEAWLARLKPMAKSSGPLLPPEERTLARRRALAYRGLDLENPEQVVLAALKERERK